MKRRYLLVLLAGGLLMASMFETGLAQKGWKVLAPLEEITNALTIEAPRTHQNLSIYPLTITKVTDPTPYMTLDEAMAKDLISITEWGSGQVPKLKVENRGTQKIFIMTGEIMTGAKQDRMSGHDVLVGRTPRPIALPVYCVERGRWVTKSQRFEGGGTAGTKKLRRSAVKKYDQVKIWNDVAEKSRDSGVRSSTGTMQAVYCAPRLRQRTTGYVEAFRDLPQKNKNMVGFIAVTEGEIASADIFVNPRLFEGLWKKLLRATAVDAVTQKDTSGDSVSLEQVQQFLADGLSGEFKRVDNPGLGQEFLIEGENGVSGSTLFHGDSVIHLALFPAEKGENLRELSPEVTHIRDRRYPPDRETREGGSEKDIKRHKKVRIRTYKDRKDE